MKTSPRTSCRIHRAFTLIELLVVITIIMILASLLFPAMKKARELSRTVMCLNQEKQLAMLCLMHLETTGAVPAPGASMSWWDKTTEDPKLISKLLRCPTMQPLEIHSTIMDSPYSVSSQYMYRYHSYGINVRMTQNRSHTRTNVFVKNARYPSKAGLLGETLGGPLMSNNPPAIVAAPIPSGGWCDISMWNHGTGLPTTDLGGVVRPMPSVMYQGSMNMAFLDGHVENVAIQKARNHWYQVCFNDWDYWFSPTEF